MSNHSDFTCISIPSDKSKRRQILRLLAILPFVLLLHAAISQFGVLQGLSYWGNITAWLTMMSIGLSPFLFYLVRHELCQQANKHLYITHLVEHLKQPVALTQPDGRIIWINKAFAAETHFDPDTIKGKPINNYLLDGKHNHLEWPEIIHQSSNANSPQIELLQLMNNGGEYWATYHIHPVFNAKQQLCNYLIFHENINEQKLNQQRRHRLSQLEYLTSLILTILIENKDLKHATGRMLSMLGSFYSAGDAFYCIFNQDGKQATVYSHWQNPKAPPQPLSLQQSSESNLWLYQMLNTNKIMMFSDIKTAHDMPPNLQKALRSRNTQALLYLPVFANQKLYGYLAIEHAQAYAWREEENILLQLVTQMLANIELQHKSNDERIQNAQQLAYALKEAIQANESKDLVIKSYQQQTQTILSHAIHKIQMLISMHAQPESLTLLYEIQEQLEKLINNHSDVAKSQSKTSPPPQDDQTSRPTIRSQQQNQEAFALLLNKYVITLHQAAEKIEIYLENDQPYQAHSICHQLKGTASSYGFPQIAELAQICEREIKRNSDKLIIKEKLSLLIEELRSVETKQHEKENPQ